MVRSTTALAGLFAMVVAAAAPAGAGTTGAVYDMNAMLGAPHPFTTAARQQQARQPAPARPAPQPAMAPAPKPDPAPTPDPDPAPTPDPEMAARPAKSADGGGWYGLHAVRLGAFYNDFGPFSHQKEGGVQANAEVLFESPDFLDVIWNPYPHVGTSINTAGDTSVPFYAGLSWEWDFWDHFMGGFSLGGAYHNGYTDQGEAPTDRKELGCSILFRESAKLGWRITDHHELLAHFDHISNAKLCDTNEGLESLGLQYSYRF